MGSYSVNIDGRLRFSGGTEGWPRLLIGVICCNDGKKEEMNEYKFHE